MLEFLSGSTVDISQGTALASIDQRNSGRLDSNRAWSSAPPRVEQLFQAVRRTPFTTPAPFSREPTVPLHVPGSS